MRIFISSFFIATNIALILLGLSLEVSAKDLALPTALVEQRADPCLYQAANKQYYFVPPQSRYLHPNMIVLNYEPQKP